MQAKAQGLAAFARPRKKKRRSVAGGGCPSEHEEQKALIIWAQAQIGRGRAELALLFAIPNGGDRHPAVAGKLYAEGVKSGVPDLFLPVARGGWHGLFIEMKRRLGGKLTDRQRAWHDRLRAQGYVVEVARGFEEARRMVEGYLDQSLRICSRNRSAYSTNDKIQPTCATGGSTEKTK